MFDPYIRPLIDPPLNHIAKKIAVYNINANIITLIGFTLGLSAILFIYFENYYTAAFFIALNRLFDGLDGAVARQNILSDFGGFLDIVCDFIIYAGIVFAFALINPNNQLPAVFLIFSFIGPITSFLAYAIIAAKKDIHTHKRGKKSFYHLGGICEGTETAFILILMCLIPTYFAEICYIYGFLCWLTTMGRVYCAWVDFK
jgi:phosphatidylglycerophosphate synthase